MPERKGPRPGTAAATGDGLKLHRRPLRADGRGYSVITLRPGTPARFSTNRFHDTWHILSDLHGARLLGRLLWGLSFQRLPGTVVVIDRPHLDPNPFDAEPADPIVLVPAHLTTLTARAIRRLRRAAAEPSHGTVRWHTWGLDTELDRARRTLDLRWPEWEPPVDTHGAAIERTGGALVFRAPPSRLRLWAVDVVTLGEQWYHDMDYTYLHPVGRRGPCGSDGEVQIFRDYRLKVSAARTARREVLAGLPPAARPDDVNRLIWRHADTVRARRGPAVRV
ncbi:hypothetical protein [Microbispora sp. KK1-11]|uniref:hypothetical protein n=1 Tax=Microbispora sp. KK1-11 TaxID=2053005 RepID=UPI00115AF4E3|nr:hypothetical protein [Microbispora sp. KK1-11]TQS19231.1 hypothetical protein FLW16_41965 [Microbispora sp. KK1-11]